MRQITTAAAKQSWLPGSKIPTYLESLPASYGFDPLKVRGGLGWGGGAVDGCGGDHMAGLGAQHFHTPTQLGEDSDALKWYQQAELIHGRWAMLGVAGILFPALLTNAGLLSVPLWTEAGLIAQQNSSIPFATLLVIEHILLGFVEVKRLQDFRKPGSQAEPGSFLGLEGSFKGKEVGYPGGLFDPLGFSRGSAESFEQYKVKEIKNGRLAMIAFLGFTAQAYATGVGPVENLAAHLANPWGANFATNGVSLPFL